MKKIITTKNLKATFLAAMLCLFSNVTFGQLNYTTALASRVAGGAYTLNSGAATIVTMSNNDDANSSAQNIGFSFNYNNSNFTQFVMNTNGWLKLGSGAPSTTAGYGALQNMSASIMTSGANTDQNVLCPFVMDLDGGVGVQYSVETTGAPGSQVCTIEWKNVVTFDDGVNPQLYTAINFQVKLYETSNRIEFVYGTFTPKPGVNNPFFLTAAVGLKGLSNASNQTLCVVKGSTAIWASGIVTFANSANATIIAGQSVNHRNNQVPAPGTLYRFNPDPAAVFVPDANIQAIYSLGQVPKLFSLPHSITALVRNDGGGNTTGPVTVTLNITGANTFSDVVNIASMAFGTSSIVTFAPYSPANTGTTNVTVTVSTPGDANAVNNTKVWHQTVTSNAAFYKDSTLADVGGVGFNGATGDFVEKFTNTVPGQSINEVNVNFFAGGQPYQLGIWNSNGAGKPGTNVYTSPTTLTSVAGSNNITLPNVVVADTFFVGVRQTGTTNVSFAYQSEVPPRSGCFFFTSPTGGTTWNDFAASGSAFRFSLQVKYRIPAPPNCATNMLPLNGGNKCSNVDLTWQSGGNAPTGYKIYYGTDPLLITGNIENGTDLGNTFSYHPTGLTLGNTYYWKIVPYNPDGDAIGCSIQSFVASSCILYCITPHTVDCSAADNINSVTYNNLSNLNTGCTSTNAQGYTIYDPIGTNTTDIPRGSTLSLSVTPAAQSSISVWIDEDQDGNFEASEWRDVTRIAGSTAGVASSVNIVIPGTATLGLTGMRIRSRVNDTNIATDACSSFGSGETEDYTINIIPEIVTPPACTAVTVNNASCVTGTSLSWPAAANYPEGYTVYLGTDGGGIVTPSSVLFASDNGTSLSVLLPTLAPNTLYYYQVVPYNANGDAIGCTIGSFFSGASVAYTPTAASPYVQNFDGVSAPALPCGITTSDENFPQDGFTWVTTNFFPSSAPNSMGIGYNSNNNTVAKDDWFYSAPLNLVAGKLYRVYFEYAASSATFPEAFEIYMSSAAEAATMLAQSSVYTKSNITNIAYVSDSSADIIPATSGVYYIGFHANSTADQDILLIDNVKVKNIPVAALQPASCTTVTSMYTPIYCNTFPGATNYRYKIENLASSFSEVYTRNLALNDFRLKWAPGVTFGTTYDVSVAAFVGGVWTPYGASCPVTTGPFPTTKLSAVTSCGATISSLSQQLTCDSISGANDYEYRIVNVAQGYDHTWRRVTSANDYRLSWAYSSNPPVQGIPYGFTYDIQVRALVGKTNVLPGVWGTFGPVCTVTVTGTPQTQLTGAFCGITLTNFTTPFNCIAVAGATDYEWRVSNVSLGYSQTGTRTNSNTNYQLNWLPGAGGGIRYGTTYDVEVRAKVGGVFGTYGTVCQLTTPASPLTSLQLGFCSNYLLPTFSSQVFCTAVPGATNYRYHITGPSGYDKTFNRNGSNNDWRFNWTILSPPNQNMVANATYNVEVASFAGGVWSAYGSMCTIVTPAVVPRYGSFIDENPSSQEVGDLTLSVQPNPSTSKDLAIVLEGIRTANTQVQISIYNMLGRKVYAAAVTTDEESRLTLRPETTLAPGVYMAEVIVNGKSMQHKFVIE